MGEGRVNAEGHLHENYLEGGGQIKDAKFLYLIHKHL